MSDKNNKGNFTKKIKLHVDKADTNGGVITQSPHSGKWWVIGENKNDGAYTCDTYEDAIELAKKRGFSTTVVRWGEE